MGLAVWLKAPSGAPIAVLLLGLAALTLAVGLRQLRLPAAPMLVAAALLLGFWRVEASPAPTLPIVPTGADVTVTLIVTDAPESAGSRLRFRGRALVADDPLQSDVPAGTNLQVYTLPPPELVAQRSPPYLRYGDTLPSVGSVGKAPGPSAILTTRPTWNRSRFQACYGRGSPNWLTLAEDRLPRAAPDTPGCGERWRRGYSNR